MANQAFTTLATNPLKAQPVTETKIYIRSDNAADSTVADLGLFGTVSASPDSETIAVAGKLEVESSNEYTAISQALLTAACDGTVSGYALGVAAVGDIRVDTLPSAGATLTISGAIVASIEFVASSPTEGQVVIGATIEDCADNIATELVGLGFTATADGGVVTVTDSLACNRQLPIVFDQSAENFSIRQLAGGEDGLLLFSIGPAVLQAADTLTFSAEDHTGATLPALMLGTSPAVAVNGGAAMIRIWGDEAIKWKIESSTDLTNWHPTSEGEQTLVTDTLTNLVLAELHEYIRFVVTENTNTVDVVLDARVIW